MVNRLLLAIMPLLAAVPARAEVIEAAYVLTLGGSRIGSAEMKGDLSREGYVLTLQARVEGFAGIVPRGAGKATSRGAFSEGRAVPANYALNAGYKDVVLTERVRFVGGEIAFVDIDPEIKDKSGRVPLAPEHSRGVMDPVSALMAPAQAPCKGTVPVNDGTNRFDLATGTAPSPAATSVAGPLQTCSVSYRPVAGHDPKGWGLGYLAANEGIRVGFAKVGRSGVSLPARIVVPTPLGEAVADAVSWKVTGTR